MPKICDFKKALKGKDTGIVKTIGLAAILLAGLVSGAQSLAAVVVNPCEDTVLDQSFDRLRRFVLNDAVAGSGEYYRFTDVPEYRALEYQGLEIRPSNDPQFEYIAHSPYYKVFFKGKTVKMVVGGAWI